MAITLQIADDSAQWDELLSRAQHRTIFHTWKWLKIVEKHTKTKLYPLIGLDGTTPIGIFPIFYRKKFLKLIYSQPYRTGMLYLGPLIIDYENMKQSKKESTLFEFLKAVDNFIFSKLKGNYAHICSSPGLLDSRPFLWNRYEVRPLYTMIVNLDKDLDSIWNDLDKITRKEINLSMKKGVSIEQGSRDDLDFIYDHLTKRLEERGIKLNSRESAFHPDKFYLHDIFDSFFPQNLKVFIAKYKGERVGGLVVLYYETTAISWIGAPKVNLKGVYPNSVLGWEVIKWAKENDFKYFQIMDSGSSQSLSAYKSKFNPSLSIWFLATKYSSNITRIKRLLYKIAKKDDLIL